MAIMDTRSTGGIAPLLSALVVGGFLGGCSEPKPVVPETVRPVHFATVHATASVRRRVFSGVARPALQSQLSFRVAGTVNLVNVKVGDRVAPGGLIATLDPVDYELQVEEAKASLAQARAQARNAEAELQRVRELYENDNASKAEYDAVRAKAESARAQVDAVQKRLERGVNQVTYTRLRAPVAGAIAEVQVEVNENVAAGRPVVVLTSQTEPEVEIDIPDILITKIRRGDSVTARFDALVDQTFPGKVTEVGVSTTGTTTTFPVIARLDSPNSEILPGMAAEVEFRFDNEGRTAQYVVASEAVGEDRHGRFVFVIEGTGETTGIVRRRTVEVGRLTSDGLEILQGVGEGDRIVTAGLSRIEDGSEVLLTGLTGG